MIIIGKVTHVIFTSADGGYHIFNVLVHGGKPRVATYVGIDPPKPMKTIQYEFRGEEATHPKYGKQFSVSAYVRSNAKSTVERGGRHLKKLEQAAQQHMNTL